MKYKKCYKQFYWLKDFIPFLKNVAIFDYVGEERYIQCPYRNVGG
ncbi:hypothetical protein ACP6PL_07650 [Dapis sp. BLCC M126]